MKNQPSTRKIATIFPSKLQILPNFILNSSHLIYNKLIRPFVKPLPYKVPPPHPKLNFPILVELTQIGYTLGAIMVTAEVEDSNRAKGIAAAEEMGLRIFRDFQSEAFRRSIENEYRLPLLEDITLILQDLLDREEKQALFTYMNTIANANGVLVEQEAKLLNMFTENILMEYENPDLKAA